MPDNEKLTAEQAEVVEDFVMASLTNEPSEPLEVERYKVRLVFRRPSMVNKFKQRAWAARKLKELEVGEGDDPQILFLFRYWGTLNSYVEKIFVENPDGGIKLSGKKYSEYEFDRATELDYKSLFEKYVMKEIYDRGLSEETFVSEVILLHANWINENSKVSEDDIKNS
jgi:hypothetical protein